MHMIIGSYSMIFEGLTLLAISPLGFSHSRHTPINSGSRIHMVYWFANDVWNQTILAITACGLPRVANVSHNENLE